MLDHTHTATQLENDARRLLIIQANTCRTVGEKREVALIREHMLGLADHHLAQAAAPSIQDYAENLLQAMAQELQEILDAMDEAGNDPMAGATIQSLLDDHNAYFIASLNPPEDDQDLTPANLASAATAALIPA